MSTALPGAAELKELAGANAPPLRELTVPARAGERAPRVLLVDASAHPPLRRHETALRAYLRALSERTGTPCCSRSYSPPLALLALHDAAVGVDIERVQPCEESFAASIQTPVERAAGAPRRDPDRHFTALWSSKEALSKALGDPLAYDPRRLEGPGAWPQGRSGPWRVAALDVGADHVAWTCWRAA
jgi:hypothetical protein